MKLLLHCCCAPCCGAILESLLKDGIRPVLFFCNPNIVPEEEYRKRKDELCRYAAKLGVEVVDDDYDHSVWLGVVKGHESDPERGGRCALCFRHRLLRSARYALANGFDTLATTLASSRWKDLSQVDRAGMEAVALALEESGAPTSEGDGGAKALAWWGRNWRKGGLQERRGQIIREQGFYNQNYCGCEFSFREEKQ